MKKNFFLFSLLLLFSFVLFSKTGLACPSPTSTVYLYTNGTLVASANISSPLSNSTKLHLGARNALYDNVQFESNCSVLVSEDFEANTTGCFNAGSISSDGIPGNAISTGIGPLYPQCPYSEFNPNAQAWKLTFDSKPTSSSVEYEATTGLEGLEIGLDTDGPGIISQLTIPGATIPFNFTFDSQWHYFVLSNYPQNNTAPTHSTPLLNSSTGGNLTTDNLTVYNVSTADADGDSVQNIYNWFRNNMPIALVNLPFEGGSTATFTKDYSSLENNGTVSGATWSNTSGYNGFGAYSFDGNDYIDLGGKQMYQIAQNVTLMAWVYKNSTAVGFAAGIPYDNGSVWDAPWVGIQIGASGPAGARFWINVNGTDREYSHSGRLTLDTWHHLAQTYDGVVARGYVDGVEVATSAFPGTIQYSGLPNFTIGIRSLQAAGEYWVGKVDDARLYNRTLSAEQIKAIYDNKSAILVSNETREGDVWTASITPNDGSEDGIEKLSNNLTIYTNQAPTHLTPILNSTSETNTTIENLTIYNVSTQDFEGDAVKNIYNWFRNNTPIAVANLPFEGGSSSSFTKDYSSLENNGTVNGATWNATAGYDGFGAYTFLGTGANNITLKDSSSLDITSDQLTLEAWIKPQGPAGFKQIIARASGTGSTQRQYGLYAHSAGTLGFEVRTTNGLGDNNFGTITSGTWHHVVGAYNGTMMLWYIDGVEVGNWSQTGNIQAQISDVQIGQFPAGFSKFNGTIDEVRIYNISLPAEQVLAHYRNRSDSIAGSTLSNRTLLRVGDTWNASVTPVDSSGDGSTRYSTQVIISSVPVNIENMTEWIFVKEISTLSGNSIIASELPPLTVAKVVYYVNVTGTADENGIINGTLSLTINNDSTNTYTSLGIKEIGLSLFSASNFTLMGYNFGSTGSGTYGEFILSRDTINNQIRLINNGWGLASSCCFTTLWGAADVSPNATISEMTLTASTGLNGGKIIIYKSRFFN